MIAELDRPAIAVACRVSHLKNRQKRRLHDVESRILRREYCSLWLAGEPIEIFEHGINQLLPAGIETARTSRKQFEQIARLFGRLVPIRRGGGKPHIIAEVFRTGGERVRVCLRFPNGISESEYRTIISRDPKAERWGWEVRYRDAGVYARGTVRHSDHATITLRDWHRVWMNTETTTRTMANVAFLD